MITCYKDITLDPMEQTNPSLTTVNWRDPPVNQPENALLGVMYESQLGGGVSFPWIVTNANSWVYSGTGLQNGDDIVGLVGYEYDKVYNNGLTPAGLVTLSNSPIVNSFGNHSFANGSVYTAPSGAFVFDAGTMYFALKMASTSYQHPGVDYRVQRMAANILGAMITGVVPTPAPSPTNPPPNPNGNATVYDESLASGWQNWSWGGSVNLADTSHPYSGAPRHQVDAQFRLCRGEPE